MKAMAFFSFLFFFFFFFQKILVIPNWSGSWYNILLSSCLIMPDLLYPLRLLCCLWFVKLLFRYEMFIFWHVAYEIVRFVFLVHGNWGPWGPYSQCSRTCNGGEQTRKRKCDNPAPKYGGKGCVGADHEKRKCGLKRCPGNLNIQYYLWP